MSTLARLFLFTIRVPLTFLFLSSSFYILSVANRMAIVGGFWFTFCSFSNWNGIHEICQASLFLLFPVVSSLNGFDIDEHWFGFDDWCIGNEQLLVKLLVYFRIQLMIGIFNYLFNTHSQGAQFSRIIWPQAPAYY